MQKPTPALEKKKPSSQADLARNKRVETLIIGIGNEYRGDDGVGRHVAKRLATLDLLNVRVLEHTGEGADLIEDWQGAESVYLIDAVSGLGLIGSVYRFEVQHQPLPSHYFGVSSHAFGVAEAIEISRRLGQLPSKLVIYGIESCHFETGEPLSPEVRQAAENVIRQVLQEIEGL